MKMMAAFFAGAGIDTADLGREEILPAKLAIGIGIFSFQSIGEVHFSKNLLQVNLVNFFYKGHLLLQGSNQFLGRMVRRSC